MNAHSLSEAAQFNPIVTGMKTSFTPFTILIVGQNMVQVEEDEMKAELC